MKNLLLLLPILFFMSCSGDDDSSEQSNQSKIITCRYMDKRYYNYQYPRQPYYEQEITREEEAPCDCGISFKESGTLVFVLECLD